LNVRAFCSLKAALLWPGVVVLTRYAPAEQKKGAGHGIDGEILYMGAP